MADNWVSPTEHNDPSSKWASEANAYDDNMGTWAANNSGDNGYYLELTISAIKCDKVRIYARGFVPPSTYYNPDLDIDVYYSSAWHNIFSGSIVRNTWIEKAIGSTQTVTKARVKHNTSGRYLYLFEFDFNCLPPIVETDACSDVKPTSFDANGDIIISGGATKRGFHYSKVFDGFEWGSDEDPLDDAGGAIDWSITAAGSSKVEIDTAQHYSGTRSARLYRDGTNHPLAYFAQTAITSSQVLSWRVRKDETSYSLMYHGDGSSLIGVRVASDEDVEYRTAAGWVDTGADVAVGGWYLLEVRNANWVSKTYDIYLDGTLIKSGADMYSIGWAANYVNMYNLEGTSELWLDEVAVWDVEDEDGSFGEGEYSLEITGLDSVATYYVQAFAKNGSGFGYGDVVSITMAFTPSPVSAIAQVIAPTVIHGSISITPTPLTSVCITIDPQVILGSTDSSPPPVTTVGQAVAPTVVHGSLTFIGMVVSAATTGEDGEVVLHSSDVTPTPVTAIASTIINDVIGGTTVYTPSPADTITRTLVGSVSGSQTIKPLPAETIVDADYSEITEEPPQIHVQSSFGTIILRNLETWKEETLPIPVLKGKSFVIATTRSNYYSCRYSLAIAYLTDLQGNEYHKIRVERGGGSFFRDCYVDYQVITGEGFTVQEGEVDFSNGFAYQYADLATTVDLTKAFIVTSSKATGHGLSYSLVKTSFHSTSALIFRVGFGHYSYYPTVRWQVVEWDGATVQNGEGTITAGNVVSTVDSLNPVDETHTFVIHNYKVTVADNIDLGMCWAKITNPTSVEFRRGGDRFLHYIDYEYFVVEHPELTVQKGDIQLTSAQTENSDTLGTAVELDKAFIPSYSIGNGYCDCASYSYAHRGFHTLELEDTTTVTVRRGISGDNLYSHYQVCSLVSVVPTISIAEAIAGAVDPTVIHGSITLTPSAVSTIAKKEGPTVVLSPVIIAPTAISAVGNVVAPSVIYGSVSITPSPSDAIANVVAPIVIVPSVIVTPSALTAVCTAHAPLVITTDDVVVLPTSSTAVATVVTPTVVLGSMTVTPAVVSAICTVNPPIVTTGDVIIIPTAVNAVAVSIPPTVIGGDLTLTLSAATAVANVNPPSVGLSSMVVTPTAVSAVTGVSITVLVTTLGYQTKMRLYTETYHDVKITTKTYHDVEVLTKTYHDVKIWTGESNMAIRRDWERGETIPIWAEVKLVSTGALYSPLTGGLVLYVYDPDGTVLSTINGEDMDEDSTGMFVYYWNSPADADSGWHRAKGKVTDGSGDTVKITIENGGFNIRE